MPGGKKNLPEGFTCPFHIYQHAERHRRGNRICQDAHHTQGVFRQETTAAPGGHPEGEKGELNTENAALSKRHRQLEVKALSWVTQWTPLLTPDRG